MRFAPKMLSTDIAHFWWLSPAYEHVRTYFRTRTRYIIYTFFCPFHRFSNNNEEAPCSLVHFASDKFFACFSPRD